jgi:acetyl esterase/lipase
MRPVAALVLLILPLSYTLARGPQAKAAVDDSDAVLADRDIEYARAGDVSLRLDVYRPKSESTRPRPCVVWIHGGGWRGGSKASGAQRLAPLVATGEYVGVSVDYRLIGVAIWPAQIHDCKAAIRYLRAQSGKFGIDPDKIGVWGASAGGHLVSLLGTAGDVKALEGEIGTTGVSSRVACVVDFCGPSDFLLPGIGAPNASDRLSNALFGGALQDRQDTAIGASPVTYVTNDDPPFLIMHGTQDKTVHIRQAERLYEAQKQAGVNTIFVTVEGGGHGFGGPEVSTRVKTFLDRHLLGKDVVVSARPIQALPAEPKEK